MGEAATRNQSSEKGDAMHPISGLKVLITGAGTGIGRGMAIEFARMGCIVSLHYSHNSEGADSAIEEIKSAGGRARTFAADFNSLEQVRRLAAEAIEYMQGIDVLINNAGITFNAPFEKVTPLQFDTLFNVNVRAPFFLIQAVVPTMAAQKKGVVINLSSVHAFAGMTEHTVYAGTKGAIVAYTRALALELVQKGIRVNCLAPGWVRVENQEQVLGSGFDWKAAGRSVPAGHVGTPSDIANFAAFLASDAARYIVGQTIVVDGGQLAVLPLTGDFRKPREVTFGQQYIPSR